MIEAGLYSYLSSNTQVSAIVGDRIYPLMIPLAVYDAAIQRPCLVYQRDGSARQRTYCGDSNVVNASFQIDAYAIDYDSAISLADAVRVALVAYRGVMGAVTVKDVVLENDFDLLDTEPGLYRRSMNYTVWYVHE